MVYTAQGSGDQTTFEEFKKSNDLRMQEADAKFEELQKDFENKDVVMLDKMKLENAKEHSFETSTHKNKPCALDGAIRDSLSKVQFGKYEDSVSPNQLTILSHTMQVSNGLGEKIIKKNIKSEVTFFDKFYFLSRKDTSKCAIDWYYSGHGLPGALAFSKNERMFYENLIDAFVSNIENHTVALFKDNADLNNHTFTYPMEGVDFEADG